MKKIITHANHFHADELLAIALIHYWAGEDLPIERVNRVSEDDLGDREVFVVDIGMEHNPDLNNFDHHQDGELPAANVLVLEHLLDPNHEVAQSLYKTFFKFVSDNDTGNFDYKILEGLFVPTISSMIRTMNGLDNGFEKALTFVKIALEGAINSSELFFQSKKEWASYDKIEGICISDSKKQLVGWRTMAIDEKIHLLMCPNLRNKAHYQIVSRDTNNMVIPKNKNQTFLHPAQFLAVYPSKDLALQHAKEIVSSQAKQEAEWPGNGL